jgi:hypothetical protein
MMDYDSASAHYLYKNYFVQFIIVSIIITNNSQNRITSKKQSTAES